MKTLIFTILIVTSTFIQLHAQQVSYKDGKVAWNGSAAYHDNGKVAWSGSAAYHDNGKVAWSGSAAYHDNGKVAWNGNAAYYDDGKVAWNGSAAYHFNGKVAWNGSTVYYDNGQILAQNLYTQIQGTNLNGLELSELEVSNKIKLLTKKFNNKVCVVGLKIRLSEKNAILIDRENNLTTNIIELDKDIHFEIVNKKVKLSVLGQKVIGQK